MTGNNKLLLVTCHLSPVTKKVKPPRLWVESMKEAGASCSTGGEGKPPARSVGDLSLFRRGREELVRTFKERGSAGVKLVLRRPTKYVCRGGNVSGRFSLPRFSNARGPPVEDRACSPAPDPCSTSARGPRPAREPFVWRHAPPEPTTGPNLRARRACRLSSRVARSRAATLRRKACRGRRRPRASRTPYASPRPRPT